MIERMYSEALKGISSRIDDVPKMKRGGRFASSGKLQTPIPATVMSRTHMSS